MITIIFFSIPVGQRGCLVGLDSGLLYWCNDNYSGNGDDGGVGKQDDNDDEDDHDDNDDNDDDTDDDDDDEDDNDLPVGQKRNFGWPRYWNASLVTET